MVPSSLNEPCTLELPTPLRPYAGIGDSGMRGTIPASGARFRSNRKSAPLPTGILPHIKRNPAPLPLDSMPHFDRNPQLGLESRQTPTLNALGRRMIR